MNSFVEVLGDNLDNIKTVNDFIQKDDLILIKSFFDDLGNNDVTDIMHLKETYHFDFPKEIKSVIRKYDALIVEKAKELYKFDFINGENILRGTIHKIGSWSHPHTDILEAELEPQKPDDEEFVGWRDAWDGYLACNLYINDNYSGGEVFFPERNVSIKPVANQLIMWPGNKYFIHGVNDPIDAGRYTLTRWIKFVDFDKYRS